MMDYRRDRTEFAARREQPGEHMFSNIRRKVRYSLEDYVD